MTKKLALWIFLLGAISSSALFLYVTYDTQKKIEVLSHADKLSAEVVAGKRAFEKYNCNDCHTILGFGDYNAPNLTKVVQRVGEEGIKNRIRSPEKALEKSWRKMPKLNVAEAEIGNLEVFFQWMGKINKWGLVPTEQEKEIIVAGAAVYKTKGCMNCHSLNGAGGTFGPSHDHIGSKLTSEQIEFYVKDPESVNPNAMMPPQTELSAKELEEVAKFLAGMK